MSGFITKSRAAAAFIARFGVIRFVREVWYRSINEYHDRRLGVHTTREMAKSALGIERPDSIDYVPIGYRALYTLLRKVPLDASSSVFLDYGAGKGRALAVAATLPFKRIIGVELSGQLAELAKTNLASMRGRRVRNVDIYEADATAFQVPADVNVVYFFNPFIGGDLARVVDKLRRSYEEFPRKMHIIFFNDDHFERIVNAQHWLVKTYRGTFYPNYSCGIYETQPTPGM